MMLPYAILIWGTMRNVDDVDTHKKKRYVTDIMKLLNQLYLHYLELSTVIRS